MRRNRSLPIGCRSFFRKSTCRQLLGYSRGMAIHTEHETTHIRAATELFRQRCLLSDGSLFREGTPLWTAQNLAALHTAFVAAPDTSDRSFDVKFSDQLANQSTEVKRLAAEVVAVHFLFPVNIGGARKKQLVSNILSSAGEALPPDHEVSLAFDTGIGSGGPGINFRRHVELQFVIEFGVAWRKLTQPEAIERLEAPGWKFMEFVDEVPGAESAQTRHMLLHLLFPETFERIASGADKHHIGRVFGGLAGDEADSIDRRLFNIRQELEKLEPGEALDFYWSPLVEAWRDEAQGDAEVSPLDALLHKKQIVLYGPPGTSKTHRAKEIAAQLIRSAALKHKQWGAGRYFKEAAALEESVKAHVRVLQLHPAYSYEDFVRGLHLLDGGSTAYRPGFLLDLIEEMNGEPADARLPYVLILDEINRTDLSRLLGECFSLLENREATIELPGRNADGTRMQLKLPADLYVIGTMNLIDQSIEQIDFALRRRFFWFECPFNAHEMLRIIEKLWTDGPPTRRAWDRVRDDFARLAAAAAALNVAIHDSALLGAQYEIGHTYFFDAVAFLGEQLADAPRQRILLWHNGAPTKPVRDLWNLALRPLLREYLSGLDANARQTELGQLEETFFTMREPLGTEE